MSERRVDNFTSDTMSDGWSFDRLRGTGSFTWENTTGFSFGSLGRLKLTNIGGGISGDNVWRWNKIRGDNIVSSSTWNTSTGTYTGLNLGAVVKILDANNFILGQYHKVNNRGEIWKCDNGVYTLLATGSIPNFQWQNGTGQISLCAYGNTLRLAHNGGSAITDYGGPGSNDAFTYTLAGADATKFGTGVKGGVGFRVESDTADREYLTNVGVELLDPSGTTPSASNSEDYVWFVGNGADNSAAARSVFGQIFNNQGVVYLGNVSPANSAAGFTTGFHGVYGPLRADMRPLPGADDWALGAPTRHEDPGMYDEYWAPRNLAKPDGNHHHHTWQAGYFKNFKIIMLNTEELGGAGNGISESQLGFLDYHLDKDRTKPTIVVGHRPVWSATSTAGKGDQSDLEPVWDLMKGRSMLYIAGHSRNYQRIVKDGITQVIAGAGGQTRDPINTSYPDGYAYANDAVNGILRVRFGTQTSTNVTVYGTYVRDDGVALDTFTIDTSPSLVHWKLLEGAQTALDNPWKFVLTSADAQTIYGEITNARDRSVSDPHMGTPGLSCTIRVDHALADTIINEECLIKAYRGDKLIFHGPVVSVEEVGEANGQSMRITAAGAWWRATKRIIPASTTENGLSYPANYSTSRESVMPWLLNYANGYNVTNGSPFTEDVLWFTGIQWGGGIE